MPRASSLIARLGGVEWRAGVVVGGVGLRVLARGLMYRALVVTAAFTRRRKRGILSLTEERTHLRVGLPQPPALAGVGLLPAFPRRRGLAATAAVLRLLGDGRLAVGHTGRRPRSRPHETDCRDCIQRSLHVHSLRSRSGWTGRREEGASVFAPEAHARGSMRKRRLANPTGEPRVLDREGIAFGCQGITRTEHEQVFRPRLVSFYLYDGKGGGGPGQFGVRPAYVVLQQLRDITARHRMEVGLRPRRPRALRAADVEAVHEQMRDVPRRHLPPRT